MLPVLEMKSYWDLLAENFSSQGGPLRPSPEDTRLMEQALHRGMPAGPDQEPQALMLGVTPEIARLAWPPGTHLAALEKSRAMIEHVWPGDIPGRRRVIFADWLEYPLSPASLNWIVGDGFTSGLSYPHQYKLLAQKFLAALRPDGRAIVRLFVRPEKAESLEATHERLRQGSFGTFDALKWRLGMALQNNVEDGVRVADIFAAWSGLEQQFPNLASRAGWSAATVQTIHLYRDSSVRYHFPSLEELNRVFSPWLELLDAHFPVYDLGACCPTLHYRPGNTLPPPPLP
jgi:hypothetical protein